MFVTGFATEDEIVELMNRGWEVEDCKKFGPVVGTVNNSMMLPPEGEGTRAVAVFVDASLFDVMNGMDWEKEREARDYVPVDTKERAAFMDDINYVDCCTEFGKLLEELPNDQNTDPGYRHIRITASLGGITYSKRVRFCPGCGKEFRVKQVVCIDQVDDLVKGETYDLVGVEAGRFRVQHATIKTSQLLTHLPCRFEEKAAYPGRAI